VRHLGEGVLRRLHDDRFAASNDERRHLDSCARCARRLEGVAADAGRATTLLAQPADAPAAAEPALARLRSRVAAGTSSREHALPTPRLARARRFALGAVAVPVVLVALVATASAEGWLSVFSPTAVAPITLTAGELSGLPDLSGYGHMQVTKPDERAVAGPAQAAAASGMRVLQPSSLPANVPARASWEVVGHGSATFTIDASAAAAAAARAGRAAPSIPDSLNGTSVTVQAGPAVVAVYGAGAAGASAGTGLLDSPPTLLIAQAMRPTASTNGATLQQLESFLLSQPNISPQLAAEIRAIGQPSSTLPVPIISGLMTSESVTIDGVQGVAAGDSTGLGAAVIWEKDGVVYAVGGLLPQSEVLDIARSLR
jgi:hypothetical protein